MTSASTIASADLHAFARADDAEAQTRRRIVATARMIRAERLVRALLKQVRLPADLTRALEALPARAASEPEVVEPALLQLANAAHDASAILPAAVRAAVITSGATRFSATLPHALRLRWRGCVTPPATFVSFDPSAPDVLQLRLRSGQELAVGPDHPRAIAIPSFRFGAGRMNLLPAWMLDVAACPHLDPYLAPAVTDTDTLLRESEDAARLLAEASPAHLAWVADVGVDLYPADGRTRELSSGTSPLAPGRIASTYHASASKLADNLVHEASHLYVHLASELGPLDDGTDSTEYWSPAKKRGRPIGKILVAFHAWANMADLFRALIASGLDSEGHAASSLPALREDMDSMAASLRLSRALTERGHALVAPFL